MSNNYLSIKEGVRNRNISAFDLLGGVEQLAAMFSEQEELIEELQTKIDKLTDQYEAAKDDARFYREELDTLKQDYKQLEEETWQLATGRRRAI